MYILNVALCLQGELIFLLPFQFDDEGFDIFEKY